MNLTKNITLNFRHDYESFLPNVNWRDFTWLNLYTETNGYSHYLELNIALLGFHLEFDWYRDFDKTQKDSQKLVDEILKSP